MSQSCFNCMKRLRVFIVLALALILAIITVAPWASPAARTALVDAHTGRKRLCLSFLSAPVLCRTYETDFSQIWCGHTGVYPLAAWSPVKEFKLPLGRRSPSFGFADVFQWEGWIVDALHSCSFSVEVKRHVVQNFVAMLERQDPGAARRYAADVLSYATDHRGKSVGSDCPVWLVTGVLRSE